MLLLCIPIPIPTYLVYMAKQKQDIIKEAKLIEQIIVYMAWLYVYKIVCVYNYTLYGQISTIQLYYLQQTKQTSVLNIHYK